MDLFLGLVKVTCAPFPSFAFSNSEFLLSFLELTSSIAESTYHFQICDVNSVPGLMIHIGCCWDMMKKSLGMSLWFVNTTCVAVGRHRFVHFLRNLKE
jgi:hypothetical protein